MTIVFFKPGNYNRSCLKFGISSIIPRMDERKIGNASPREMLEALLSPEFVAAQADVLAHATTPEDLLTEFRARRYTCDTEQFLLPLFRPLYEQLPEVQTETLSELEKTGVPREFINRYLTAMGDQPYVVLGLLYFEQAPKNGWPPFTNEARRVMFETVKRQLAIPIVSESQT